MKTKASIIAETVDRLQEVADETGAPALWWHLGRLEVIGSLSNLFGLAQVADAVKEALDALEQVEAERAPAAEPANPFDEVQVQARGGVLISGEEIWEGIATMFRHEAEAFVAGRPDRRIAP